MEELRKAQLAVTKEQAVLDEIGREVASIEKKHDEVSVKLSEVAGILLALEGDLDLAITQFARGEIGEDKLDELQTKVPQLQGKKKSFAAALEVIAADLTVARNREGAAENVCRARIQLLWKEVSRIELAKAAPFLRRAYAAKGKSRPNNFPGIKDWGTLFWEDDICPNAFCASASFNPTTDYDAIFGEMVNEYLP